MNEVDAQTLEFFFAGVIDRWLEENPRGIIRRELASLPELEEEIRNLIIEREMAIKTLMTKWGYIDTEIDEILSMSPEEIEAVENQGGFEQWRQKRRSSQQSPTLRLSKQ
jgi:hypothetical protein